eukprot:1124151-Prorocentrum_minimum.AAC.2
MDRFFSHKDPKVKVDVGYPEGRMSRSSSELTSNLLAEVRHPPNPPHAAGAELAETRARSACPL